MHIMYVSCPCTLITRDELWYCVLTNKKAEVLNKVRCWYLQKIRIQGTLTCPPELHVADDADKDDNENEQYKYCSASYSTNDDR